MWRQPIYTNFPRDGETPFNSISKRDYSHWIKNNQVFQALFAFGSINANLSCLVVPASFSSVEHGMVREGHTRITILLCWEFSCLQTVHHWLSSLCLQSLHTYLLPIPLCSAFFSFLFPFLSFNFLPSYSSKPEQWILATVLWRPTVYTMSNQDATMELLFIAVVVDGTEASVLFILKIWF